MTNHDAYTIACPRCQQPAEHACMTANGAIARTPHADRVLAVEYAAEKNARAAAIDAIDNAAPVEPPAPLDDCPGCYYAPADETDPDRYCAECRMIARVDGIDGEKIAPASDPRLSPAANAYNAIPLAVKNADRARKEAIDSFVAVELETRMLDAAQRAADAESAARTAAIAMSNAGREEDRAKHDYSNPNGQHWYTAAQRDAREAREHAGHAAQNAAHRAQIARYAAMTTAELDAEEERLESMLALSGMPAPMIIACQNDQILLTVERDARAEAEHNAIQIVDRAGRIFRTTRASGQSDNAAYAEVLAAAPDVAPHLKMKIANAAHLAYDAAPHAITADAEDPIAHYADRLAALAPNAESMNAYARIVHYATLIKTADLDAARAAAAAVDSSTWTPHTAGHEPHTTPAIAALVEERAELISPDARAHVTNRLREACHGQNIKNFIQDRAEDRAIALIVEIYQVLRNGGMPDSRAAHLAMLAGRDIDASERLSDRAIDLARSDYDSNEETRRENAAAAAIDAYADAIAAGEDAAAAARTAAIAIGATPAEAIEIVQLAMSDYAALIDHDGQQDAANRDQYEQEQGIGRPHPDTRDYYEPDPPYIQPIDPANKDTADHRFISTGSLSRNLDTPISPYNPPAGFYGRDDDYHIAQWTADHFIVTLWHTAPAGQHLNQSDPDVAYRLVDHGELITEGTTFHPSPTHSWDSPLSHAALISFLTLRPGDTDPEWFAKHTPARLAWLATMRPDELSMLGEELEERQS